MPDDVTTVRDSLARIAARWPSTHGQSFVLQYELTEPLPGDLDRLYVTFVNGEAAASEGTAPTADATITMSAADYLGKVNGTFNADRGFMQGKMKVSGNAILVKNLRQTLRAS